METHCPYCKTFILGETSSFCFRCKESFPEVENRWFSTAKPESFTQTILDILLG